MKKKTAKIQPPEVEKVHLKPLFGMHPGKYLTILYSALLLLVLFFILIYPGLRNFGSEVKVNSEPKGAALYMNGEYRGSTPVKLFLSAGTHTLKLEKAHFASRTVTVEVGGRVVGSLFFPRREQIQTKLELTDAHGLLAERFRQVSSWSMVGSFHDRYRYPAIVTNTAAALITQAQERDAQGNGNSDSAKISDTHRDNLYTFLHYITNNLSSPEVTADTLAALGLVFGEPNLAALRSGSYPSEVQQLPSNAALKKSVKYFRQLNIDSQLLPIYLYLFAHTNKDESAPAAEALSVEETLRSLERRAAQLSFDETYSEDDVRSEGERLSAVGHTFIPFSPARSIPLGNPNISYKLDELTYEKLAAFPHQESLGSYYLAAKETTQRQFNRFLENNPRWSKENTEELTADGKVDDNYLQYAQHGDDIPVTHVSWYAARAYSEWLTSQLPEDLRVSYRVALPSEAQWEYAARMNGRPRSVGTETRAGAPQPAIFSRAGSRGLIDMTGNVWEWNSNWYFPADVLDGTYGLSKTAADTGYHGTERSVRGGSWANETTEELLWSRASQPPSWCTPFTGFRVALVPREESK